MMFHSSGRGTRASSPPVQNSFQEVFQGRLLARRASLDTGLKGAVRRSSRLGSHREADPGWDWEKAAHRFSLPRGRGRLPLRIL